jgi:hypothetical protein
LAHYTIYRDTLPQFQPQPEKIIATVGKEDHGYFDGDLNRPADEYYYCITATDRDDAESGVWNWVNTLIINEVDDRITTGLPQTPKLEQNYPNPFNRTTVIRYTLSSRCEVSLSIYNILGKRIRTLENISKAAGKYEINWDGLDDFGQPVSSGIYFYQLKTGSFCEERKMILLK